MLSLHATPPPLPPFLFKGAAANDGALTQEFDAAKRAEIAKGVEAVQTLVEQTTVFFNNRASEQREEEKKLEALGSRDANGEWQPKPGLSASDLNKFNEAKTKYNDLQKNFGAGSPARIIATALTGAAGGNVAGNLTGLVQGVAVNVLQSLAVNQVKHIADSLYDADGKPTPGSEAVRAALQGLTACAGGAANGSGSCGGAAAGASASVVINYLLTEFLDPQLKDAQGNPIERSIEDQQARTNLVATLIGAIAAGAGLDAGSATNAAQVETENNAITNPDGTTTVAGQCLVGARACTPEEAKHRTDEYFKSTNGQLQISAYGSRELADACIKNTNATGCAEGQARLLLIEAIAGSDPAAREKIQFQLENDQTSFADLERRLENANDMADQLTASNGGAADIERKDLVQKLAQLSPAAQEVFAQNLNSRGDLTIGIADAFGLSNSEKLDLALLSSQIVGGYHEAGGAARDAVIGAATSQTVKDLALIMAAGGNPNTGSRDPYFDTPEGQAAVHEAAKRLVQTGGNALTGMAQMGMDIAILAAPPPGVGQNGRPPLAGDTPTPAEIEADRQAKAQAASNLYDTFIKDAVIALNPNSTTTALTDDVILPLATGALATKFMSIVNKASVNVPDGQWGSWDEAGNPTTWRNPVTNAIEPWPQGATHSIDHILPQKEIEDLPGFLDLTPAQRQQILSDPDNLQPLPLTDNCSKGCKLGKDWHGNKAQGTVNSPAYKAALDKMQNDQREALETKIRAMISNPPTPGE